MKPRNGLLAMALPAIVLVLVDWAFWGLRAQQAGFGVNIDGLALFAAFVVALAASAPEKAPEAPPPGVLDSLLHRLAIASFGLLAASLCGALFAFLRLSSILVGPELVSGRMGPRNVLIILALMTAPPIVWLGRKLFTRAPHALRVALALTALTVSPAVALVAQQPGARLEYLSSAFRPAASLPALSFDVAVERVMIGGSGFEYLAVSNNCVLRPTALQPNRKVSAQSVAVPVRGKTGGFAVCPAIDIYEAAGQAYGLAADSPPDSTPLFNVVGGRLTDPIVDGLFRQPASGKKVGRVPSIRAPLSITSDQDSGDGITVKRDASSLEQCTVVVREGERELHQSATPFSGSGKVMQACPPVTVVRAAWLGILNVQIPDNDISSGSLEPASQSWLDGVLEPRVWLKRVAAKVNIPKSWRTGALAGLGCGAAAFFYSLIELLRLRRLRGFVAAHHQGGGKLALGDGEIIDSEAARALEAGEVFVRGSLPKVRLPGYREPAQATAHALEVRAPEAVHLDWDRTNGRVTFASAIAFAFPIATSSLMLAARIFGLGG